MDLFCQYSCYVSSGSSPASQREASASNIAPYIWDLWWTKWHWVRFFFKYCSPVIVSPLFMFIHISYCIHWASTLYNLIKRQAPLKEIRVPLSLSLSLPHTHFLGVLGRWTKTDIPRLPVYQKRYQLQLSTKLSLSYVFFLVRYLLMERKNISGRRWHYSRANSSRSGTCFV